MRQLLRGPQAQDQAGEAPDPEHQDPMVALLQQLMGGQMPPQADGTPGPSPPGFDGLPPALASMLGGAAGGMPGFGGAAQETPVKATNSTRWLSIGRIR